MKSFRLATILIFVAGALISAIVSFAATAQRMGGPHVTDDPHMKMGGPQAAQSSQSGVSDEGRELISMPNPMREHMLANMRDHLATLDAVIRDVADNKFDAASKLLEERLGMSSLPLHHAADMAPYFPKPMQEAGTKMHHAASQLAIVLQNASVNQSFDAMREVDGALHEVTSSCVVCHNGYRVH